MDQYQTIESASIAEYKEKGSRFLAFAYPILNEQEVKAHIDFLKKEHFKARHYCFAFRLGFDNLLFRANDDGEPAGSAGKPILGRIDSNGLTNVLVVVVRYFGGTKLGVSGLTNAYKSAAQEALTNSTIIWKNITFQFALSFPYLYMNDIMTLTKKLDTDIVEQIFTDSNCNLILQVKSADKAGFLAAIENMEDVKLLEE